MVEGRFFKFARGQICRDGALRGHAPSFRYAFVNNNFQNYRFRRLLCAKVRRYITYRICSGYTYLHLLSTSVRRSHNLHSSHEAEGEGWQSSRGTNTTNRPLHVVRYRVLYTCLLSICKSNNISYHVYGH